eukprot:3323132-Prymnesium_polylepis.1
MDAHLQQVHAWLTSTLSPNQQERQAAEQALQQSQYAPQVRSTRRAEHKTHTLIAAGVALAQRRTRGGGGARARKHARKPACRTANEEWHPPTRPARRTSRRRAAR